MKILKILEYIYNLCRPWVEVTGAMVLFLLVIFSILYLEGLMPTSMQLDASKIIHDKFSAYFFIAFFTVYIVGLLGKNIHEVIITWMEKKRRPQKK